MSKSTPGRRGVENSPEESELEYKQLFFNNPNSMWIYDLETLGFLEVNNAAINKYGYSREEFLSMTIKDIRPPEDIPSLIENVLNVTEGLDEAGVWRHIKKDGSMIYVEITSHTTNYMGRRAEVVVAHDITRRIKAEEKLQESQEFLNSIIENSGDGIVTTNLEGKITLWSRGAERLYGYSREQVMGKSIDFLYPDELKEERKEWQKSILAGETLRNIRTRIYNSKGEQVYINLTLSPLRDKFGNPMGTIGVSKDINKIVQSEEMLHEKVSELEKWQRLTVGREIRMVELKKEIRELRKRLGEEA